MLLTKIIVFVFIIGLFVLTALETRLQRRRGERNVFQQLKLMNAIGGLILGLVVIYKF